MERTKANTYGIGHQEDATFDAPIVPDSPLPALLGGNSMRRLRVLIKVVVMLLKAHKRAAERAYAPGGAGALAAAASV